MSRTPSVTPIQNAAPAGKLAACPIHAWTKLKPIRPLTVRNPGWRSLVDLTESRQTVFKRSTRQESMATRLQVLIPISVAAVIVGVVGMLSVPEEAKLDAVEFPRGMVSIDGHVLQVQVADTEPRRVRGLMFQEELPLDQGMIFVFDSPGVYSLWMLNMQFPLDMIWFDGSGRVVHIEQGVPPCKSALETATCTAVNPGAAALYVLEVTAGFVDEIGITHDSRLEIISI